MWYIAYPYVLTSNPVGEYVLWYEALIIIILIIYEKTSDHFLCYFSKSQQFSVAQQPYYLRADITNIFHKKETKPKNLATLTDPLNNEKH